MHTNLIRKCLNKKTCFFFIYLCTLFITVSVYMLFFNIDQLIVYYRNINMYANRYHWWCMFTLSFLKGDIEKDKRKLKCHKRNINIKDVVWNVFFSNISQRTKTLIVCRQHKQRVAVLIQINICPSLFSFPFPRRC